MFSEGACPEGKEFGIVFVPHCTGQRDAVLGVPTDVVIHSGNVFVLDVGDRRAEIEAAVVEASPALLQFGTGKC